MFGHFDPRNSYLYVFSLPSRKKEEETKRPAVIEWKVEEILMDTIFRCLAVRLIRVFDMESNYIGMDEERGCIGNYSQATVPLFRPFSPNHFEDLFDSFVFKIVADLSSINIVHLEFEFDELIPSVKIYRLSLID